MAGQGRQDFGILGKYYSVRHALGQYRSVCVAASCSSPSFAKLSNDSLQHCIEKALQETIRQHGNLQYNLARDSNHDQGETFLPARTIARQDVLEVVADDSDLIKVDTTLQEQKVLPEDILSNQLEIAHTSLWSLNKPAWKVVVIKHRARSSSSTGSDGSICRIDFILAIHHALADGLSGATFHQSLYENLSAASVKTSHRPTWPLVLDQKVPLPRLPEESIDLRTARTKERGIDSRPVWSGSNIPGGEEKPYRSRVRLLTIPSSKMLSVIQTSKKHGISVTGYMHGIVCASLLRSLTDTEVYDFRAITPYSMRSWTKTSLREMVNHISYLTTLVSHETLSRIQATKSHSPAEQEVIIDIARYLCAEIAAELQRFPRGSAIARIGQIPDVWSHCRGQTCRTSNTTYELSNLGAASLPPLEFAGSTLTVDRLVFTQCGMMAGPPLGFSCVSLRGGPFAVSITWQDGIVEGALVDSIALELERYLLQAGLDS